MADAYNVVPMPTVLLLALMSESMSDLWNVSMPVALPVVMPAMPAPVTLATHGLLLLLAIAGVLALRRWPWVYMLSIWPGTVAHELLHYVAGLLAGARPVAFSVIPRRKLEGGWLLGSVAFARLRWWNSVPVGLAPLALMPAGGWIFLQSATWPLLSVESTGWKLAALQCLIAGWPSPKDWAHAIVGLMVMAALAVGAYLLWLKVAV